jgi:hypothetical protein
MSSLLYGALTQRRVQTPPESQLVFQSLPAGAETTAPGQPAAPPATGPLIGKVSHWQDVAAALVPAEVLALHGIAMSYGTTTTGSGENAVTRITYPGQMMVVYIAMMLLAAGLYLLGAKSFRGWRTWVRAAIPVAAFIIWTMIQPSTAFDAFPFGFTSFARTMIAVFGAIVLGALFNLMATKADGEKPA